MIEPFMSDADDQLVRDMYPHAMELFGRAGWDDPAMDIYDELDPRREAMKVVANGGDQ